MFTYELVCNQSMDDRQDVACVLTALGATCELVSTITEERPIWAEDNPYWFPLTKYTYVITATKNVNAVESYVQLVDSSDCMM